MCVCVLVCERSGYMDICTYTCPIISLWWMLDNVVIVSVNAEMVMMSYNVTTKFSQSRTVVYYYTCIHMWVLYDYVYVQ